MNLDLREQEQICIETRLEKYEVRITILEVQSQSVAVRSSEFGPAGAGTNLYRDQRQGKCEVRITILEVQS